MDSTGSRASRRREFRWGLTLLALSVVLVSCTGDQTVITTTSTTTTSTTTTTTPTTTTTTTLPGEPIDLFPEAGDVLAVVGISFDSELNVRAAPGTDQTVVVRLPSLTDDVVATGQARQLSDSIWYEITADDVTGWASSAYLAWIGETTDATAAVIDAIGETPRAETMLDLGLIVAQSQSVEEPESRIRVAKSPTVGDLGEVTYDVIGLGDDALFGVRLTVFGTPDSGGESFTLKTVESTALCARGITPEGLCP
jgi:hypothetical protein